MCGTYRTSYGNEFSMGVTRHEVFHIQYIVHILRTKAHFVIIYFVIKSIQCMVQNHCVVQKQNISVMIQIGGFDVGRETSVSAK